MADSDLEYFPDDGYDYEQHFVTAEKRADAALGQFYFIENPKLTNLKTDKFFRGEYERPLSEMDPEERELLEDLSDLDDSEAPKDEEGGFDELIQGLLPKGSKKDQMIKQLLWKGTPEEDVFAPRRLDAETLRALGGGDLDAGMSETSSDFNAALAGEDRACDEEELAAVLADFQDAADGGSEAGHSSDFDDEDLDAHREAISALNELTADMPIDPILRRMQKDDAIHIGDRRIDTHTQAFIRAYVDENPQEVASPIVTNHNMFIDSGSSDAAYTDLAAESSLSSFSSSDSYSDSDSDDETATTDDDIDHPRRHATVLQCQNARKGPVKVSLASMRY